MTTRRTLLTATALAPVVLVVGCAQTQVTQVLTDVNAILSNAQNVVAGLSSKLSSGTVMLIQTLMARAQAADAALKASLSNGDAATTFITAINDIVGTVMTLGVIPAPFNVIVDAIATLLPVVAGALGVAMPAQAHMARRAMSVASARRQLGIN